MTSTGTVNMTQGSVQKVIIKFAFPVFLSQLFQQFYNIIDSLIVGNFIDKDALAAVSSSGSLIFLLISFFMGTSMGASVAISKYFGAGEHYKVSRAIHTNVCLGLISGGLLTIIGVLFTPTILRWMNTPEKILPLSIEYFRYYFIGVIAIVMYNICKGIMNALGDSRRPLYYLIFSSLLNVGLDLLFVAGFGWGVWSAALATTVSQAISVIPCMIHLTRKGTIYQIKLKSLKISRDMLGDILKYGLPSGVQNSVIALANVMVQSNINTFGEDAVAACGAYAKIEGFAFLPITCFSMALTTFVGQNLGAGEHGRAKQAARFGIMTSMIMAEIIGVIIFFGAPLFIGAFNSSSEVVSIGVKQCHTQAFFFCLLAFSHCVAGICRGAGRAFVPMLIMLAVWCVLRIAYITVAMKIDHNIVLLFAAYPITWFISSVIYFFYYRFSGWINAFDKKTDIEKEKAPV